MNSKLANRALSSIIVLALILLAHSCGVRLFHSADDEMIKRFNDHEMEFVELVQMFQEDGNLVRIGKDFTISDKGYNEIFEGKAQHLSPERQLKYASLFERLGITYGLVRRQEPPFPILLYCSSHGSPSSGSSKGFAYSEQSLSPLFDALDTVPKKLGKRVLGYRHIRGNWYLYLEPYSAPPL